MEEKEKKEVINESLSVQERIVKISNEIRLCKDGKNDFNHYNYFTPDNIMMALNPLLDKYETFTKFSMNWNGVTRMYEGILIISHKEQKEIYTLDLYPSIVTKSNENWYKYNTERKVGPQDTGSTMTYAKRYCLMNAFNIADDRSDPDSDEITKKSQDLPIKAKIKEINYFSITKSGIETQENVDKIKKWQIDIPKSDKYTDEQKKELADLMERKIDFLIKVDSLDKKS